MKIYKVLMDMTNVITRLKRFDLGTYNSAGPMDRDWETMSRCPT